MPSVFTKSTLLPMMSNCSLDKTMSGDGFQNPPVTSTWYVSPVARSDVPGRAPYCAKAGEAAPGPAAKQTTIAIRRVRIDRSIPPRKVDEKPRAACWEEAQRG